MQLHGSMQHIRGTLPVGFFRFSSSDICLPPQELAGTLGAGKQPFHRHRLIASTLVSDGDKMRSRLGTRTLLTGDLSNRHSGSPHTTAFCIAF
jgi:hypothetical protein